MSEPRITRRRLVGYGSGGRGRDWRFPTPRRRRGASANASTSPRSAPAAPGRAPTTSWSSAPGSRGWWRPATSCAPAARSWCWRPATAWAGAASAGPSPARATSRTWARPSWGPGRTASSPSPRSWASAVPHLQHRRERPLLQRPAPDLHGRGPAGQPRRPRGGAGRDPAAELDGRRGPARRAVAGAQGRGVGRPDRRDLEAVQHAHGRRQEAHRPGHRGDLLGGAARTSRCSSRSSTSTRRAAWTS